MRSSEGIATVLCGRGRVCCVCGGSCKNTKTHTALLVLFICITVPMLSLSVMSCRDYGGRR